MKIVEFTVDGPLLGYRASVARVFKKRPMARIPEYQAYKEKVYILALQAGFPAGHEVDPENPPELSVDIFWAKAPRIDWKNVVGAIEDALWRQDRYIKSGRFCVSHGCGRECAEVRIVFRNLK